MSGQTFRIVLMWVGRSSTQMRSLLYLLIYKYTHTSNNQHMIIYIYIFMHMYMYIYIYIYILYWVMYGWLGRALTLQYLRP